MVKLQRIHFRVEGRHVFGPVVISKKFEAQPFEHCSTLLGAAFLCIKRNDAPGDEVGRSENAQIGPRFSSRKIATEYECEDKDESGNGQQVHRHKIKCCGLSKTSMG